MLSNNNAATPLIKRLNYLSESVMKLNEFQKNAKDSYLQKIETTEYTMRHNQCICGNENGILISEIDRYGLPTKTYLCEICGTMRSDPYLTETSLSQFYDNEYRPLYVGTDTCTDGFFDEQRKIGKSIYEFIEKHYALNEKNIVYEIGCGAGGILHAFKEKNCIVAGCDLGSEYVESGKKRGLDLRVGGFETLKNDEKADVIILNHVLEHITKPLELLSDIQDLLKDDGILFIALPGIYNIKKAYGDFAHYLQNAHVYHFNLKTLDNILNSSSYTQIHGDESIRAIYKKSEFKEINYDDSNAKDIIKYILNLERHRHFNVCALKLRLLAGKIKIQCENIFYKLRITCQKS